MLHHDGGNRCDSEQLMTFSTLFLSLNTPINYGSLRIISHVSGIGLSLTMTTVIIVMMTFTDRDRHGNPALCHLKLENITRLVCYSGKGSDYYSNLSLRLDVI